MHLKQWILISFFISYVYAQPTDLAKKILRHDKNKDGKITKEEFQGPQKIFSTFDKDKDGIISDTEIKGSSRNSPSTKNKVFQWSNPPANPTTHAIHKTFHSTSINEDVGYSIWLPPTYKTHNNKKFPVIYWLHGINGNESSSAKNAIFFDQAVSQNIIDPVIVVFVNGKGDSMYSDSFDRKVPLETIIIKELIPHIDKTYRTNNHRNARAIQGFSMGGFGCLKLAFEYPELFSSVVSMGGALHSKDTIRRSNIIEKYFNNDTDEFQKNTPYAMFENNLSAIRQYNLAVYLFVGDRDMTLKYNQSFHDFMNQNSFKHVFKIFPEVGHKTSEYFNYDLNEIMLSHQKHFSSLTTN